MPLKTAHRASPKVRWNDYLKLFLCVLARIYIAEWGQFTRIFNFTFAESLKAHGFTKNGVKSGPLVSQLAEMKHRNHPLWVCVNESHPNKWVGLCVFVNMIEQMVESSKIRLVVQRGIDIQHLVKLGRQAQLGYMQGNSSPPPPRTYAQLTPPVTPTTVRSRPAPPLQPPVFHSNSGSALSSHPTSPTQDRSNDIPSPSPAQWHPASPVPARSKYFTSPSSAQPHPASPIQALSNKPAPPPLLFRFWDQKSGGFNSCTDFVGGMWAGEGESSNPIPEGSSIDPRMLLGLIRAHLTRVDFPSPFISMSTSPLGVIHRALRAGNAFITILDTNKIDHTHLFSVSPILRHDPILYGKDKKSRYYGQGEWLIWGFIPSDAILTTFSTKTLFSITKRHPPIGKLLQLNIIKAARFNRAPLINRLKAKMVMADTKTGTTMGQLFKLLNVPQNRITELAQLFATKWSFRSPGDKRASFLRGVQRGYIRGYSLADTREGEAEEAEEEDEDGEYRDDDDYNDDDDNSDDDNGDDTEVDDDGTSDEEYVDFMNDGEDEDEYESESVICRRKIGREARHLPVDEFQARRASITSLLY